MLVILEMLVIYKCFLVIEILEMLVLVIEILEMLILVIKFRICIYEITIHHLKNVTLLLRHIVFVVDDARPASSPSTRSRRRPASEDPCPGLGSAGLALGGAT